MSRNKLFSIIAFLLVVFVVCVAAEVTVRIFRPYYTPDTLKKIALQYQPSVYARHVFPLQEQNIQMDDVQIHISRAGYRGRYFAIEKPKDLIRIIVIGGSSVFDHTLKDGMDWPHKAEAILRDKDIVNIEIINAGIPGHTTADSLGRLYTELWRYKPDYIVLYQAWNDIKQFHKINNEKFLLRIIKPISGLSHDPRLRYYGFWDKLFSNSQIYNKLRYNYLTSIKYQVGTEGIKPDSKPVDIFSDLAVTQYRINIELIVDISKNIGAAPILMTQARLIMPENNPADRSRIHYEYATLSHKALVKAFIECDRVLKMVADEKNVHFLAEQSVMNGKSEYFHDLIHLTKEGSQRLAEYLSGFLEEIILANK